RIPDTPSISGTSEAATTMPIRNGSSVRGCDKAPCCIAISNTQSRITYLTMIDTPSSCGNHPRLWFLNCQASPRLLSLDGPRPVKVAQMARAFLFVLDSFGIGGAPDAARFGDAGADTLGHIEAACANGDADVAGLRSGPLSLPNMQALGLSHAAAINHDRPLPAATVNGFFGAATEISSGKDTPSGHWEIAGLPVTFDWGYFPDTHPAFPQDFTDALIGEA